MPFVIQRHPDLFPDPETFIPERFIDNNMNFINPYAYIPFSAGPRNCIGNICFCEDIFRFNYLLLIVYLGQKYAMLEMKSILSKLLRNFVWKPVIPEHKLDLAGETVLKSHNGILVNIEKRVW